MIKLRRLVARDEGIALVMAVGILAVLSLAGTTAVMYTNANARSAEVSQGRTDARSLAEAGLANALAVSSTRRTTP